MDASGKQIAMTPAQVNAATDKLIKHVQQRAVQGGQNVENRQGALAPGLQQASNTPGGYNYQRFVAPNVAPLTTALTMNAKQALLKQALTDSAWRAQENYTKEKMAYDKRYRNYQNEQARRNRERRARAEREARARAAQEAAVAQAQIAAMRAAANNNYSFTAKPTPAAPRTTTAQQLQPTVSAQRIQPAANIMQVQPAASIRIVQPTVSGSTIQGGSKGVNLNNPNTRLITKW